MLIFFYLYQIHQLIFIFLKKNQLIFIYISNKNNIIVGIVMSHITNYG